MCDELIQISFTNDFLFCPVSIYFHNQFSSMDSMSYQSRSQIDGKNAHAPIDEGRYSGSGSIIQSMYVLSKEYGLIGRIDTFDEKTGILRERKKKIKKLYDGFVMQVYAQCLALREMGYTVNRLELYSKDDNKSYELDLPENNLAMMSLFRNVISSIRNFKIADYKKVSGSKCENCIYEPVCGFAEI